MPVSNEIKVEYEARFDGKWVLTTNTDLSAEQVALKYKELWRVEKVFRDIKSLKLLSDVMTKAGFIPLSYEWWHFNGVKKYEARKRYRIIE